MNPCPTPPVCEFGLYGTEAYRWGIEHEIDRRGYCSRCSGYVCPESSYCQFGHGGVFGMCGHRPLTAAELRKHYTLGNHMGQRPEVDTVNVRECNS